MKPCVLPQLANFIDGRFEGSESRETALLNPSDQSILGEQVGSSAQAIERALSAASRCHYRGDWYGLGARRADYLEAIALRLESVCESIALIEATNTGVLHVQTKFLSSLLPHIFRGAARQLREHPDCERIESHIELWRKPWGSALCLGPWNSPAPIGAHKLATALAAGAPVILKPSEWTPYSTQKLFEVIADCDLPAGAVQLIHGAAREGSQLAADARIRAVSFTGGYHGGQALSAICQPSLKALQLELGGHNAFIVLPHADREAVRCGVVEGLTRLNGQWCRAIGRIFVPRAEYDSLLEELLGDLSRLKIGSALDPSTQLGPMIHRAHKDHLTRRMLEHQSLGAKLNCSAPSLDPESSYISPSLITGLRSEDDRDEIFGPLATFSPYDDISEVEAAIRLSPYGLAAYIYGGDPELCYQVARRLEVGSTKINGVSLTSLSAKAPRCAWGISGLGEEGDFESMRFFQGASLLGTINP